ADTHPLDQHPGHQRVGEPREKYRRGDLRRWLGGRAAVVVLDRSDRRGGAGSGRLPLHCQRGTLDVVERDQLDRNSPEESDSLTVSHSPRCGATMDFHAGFNEAGEEEALSSRWPDIVTCHISPHTWQESHQSRWYASFFSSAMRVSPQRGQAGDLRT